MKLNKLVLLTTLLWACFSVAYGQGQTRYSPNNRVIWVGSISADQAVKDRFFPRLAKVIVGAKTTVGLGHPVSVVALENSGLKILDQQSKTIWSYADNRAGLTPAIRSKTDLPSLVGMCSPDGKNLAFTDSYLEKVFVLNPKGKIEELIRDTTHLKQPTGIAFHPLLRQYWIVETSAHRIAIFSENGRLIKRIGQRGNGPLEFNFPTFIWIDAEGQVYLMDSMNFRAQIINPDGSYHSGFGQVGNGTGYFARPKGIATDSYGHIYVVDALFGTVQIFDRQGNFLHTFGSRGSEAGQLWMPSNIYIDQNDNIYVADTYNSRIQQFKLMMHEKR